MLIQISNNAQHRQNVSGFINTDSKIKPAIVRVTKVKEAMY